MTPLYTAEKYTYYVAWSDADGEYVGRCSEFPSLSHLAPTLLGALGGVIDLVSVVLKDLRENEEPHPRPLAVALLKVSS